jgi:beta-glucosidase
MAILRRNSLLYALVCVVVLFTTASAQTKRNPAPAQSKTTPATDNIPNYRNPNLAIEDRVADLLSRMTLEEKVGQIAPSRSGNISVIDPTGTFTDVTAGQTLSQWGNPEVEFTPKRSAILRNGIQRYLKEKSRLGIPELFMGEALHGFMEYGSTSFPQAIGLASTWDPDLV